MPNIFFAVISTDLGTGWFGTGSLPPPPCPYGLAWDYPVTSDVIVVQGCPKIGKSEKLL